MLSSYLGRVQLVVKVRALWSGGGFVLKREMGTLGEVCMSLALSGVAMGPETAGRRRRGVVNAAAVLPDRSAKDEGRREGISKTQQKMVLGGFGFRPT